LYVPMIIELEDSTLLRSIKSRIIRRKNINYDSFYINSI
jgi:hypothetical protein